MPTEISFPDSLWPIEMLSKIPWSGLGNGGMAVNTLLNLTYTIERHSHHCTYGEIT